MPVEIVAATADRDHGRPGFGNHARHGGADAATRGAGHHDDPPARLNSGIGFT